MFLFSVTHFVWYSLTHYLIWHHLNILRRTTFKNIVRKRERAPHGAISLCITIFLRCREQNVQLCRFLHVYFKSFKSCLLQIFANALLWGDCLSNTLTFYMIFVQFKHIYLHHNTCKGIGLQVIATLSNDIKACLHSCLQVTFFTQSSWNMLFL